MRARDGDMEIPSRIRILHRPVARPRLEVTPWELRVVLPPGLDEAYAYRLIERHRSWITRKYAQLRKTAEEAERLELLNRPLQEFRAMVRDLTRRYAEELGVEPSNVYVRRMTRKWGSCTAKGKICISSLARHLPAELVEYLVYHEVCHLVERSHRKRFWRLVARRFPNFRELRKKLLAYQVKLAMLGLLRL